MVHGRHWTEHYETPVVMRRFSFVEDENSSDQKQGYRLPDFLEKNVKYGLCRGDDWPCQCVGQPWLIQKLIAEMEGREFKRPSLEEIASLFLSHIEELAQLLEYEKFAVCKHASWHAIMPPPLKQVSFCNAINECQDLNSLRLVTRHYFKE